MTPRTRALIGVGLLAFAWVWLLDDETRAALTGESRTVIDAEAKVR